MYRQLSAVPVQGSTAEYVQLKAGQAQTILNELKAGTLTEDAIWKRAAELAGEKVLTATISQSAANYAGEAYFGGRLVALDYAAAKAAQGAIGAGARAEASAGAKLLPLGLIGGVAFNVLTMTNTADAAVVDPLSRFQDKDVLRVEVYSYIDSQPSGLGSLLLLPRKEKWDSDLQTVLLSRRELRSLLAIQTPVDGTTLRNRTRRYCYRQVDAATEEEVAAWEQSRKKP